jgi:hypothetical protein
MSYWVRRVSMLGALAAVTVSALLVTAGPSAGSDAITITSGPTGTVFSRSAAFAFSSTSPAQFSCALDGGTAIPCDLAFGQSGAITFVGLARGRHSLLITATIPQPTPATATATATWEVVPPRDPGDTTPPQTEITSGPDGMVPFRDAEFTFDANESATFRCSIDGGGSSPCVSPVRFTGLALGRHSFAVAATDEAGNVDATPATAAWTVGSVAVLANTQVERLRIHRAFLKPMMLRGKPDRSEAEGPEGDALQVPQTFLDQSGDTACTAFCTGDQEGGGQPTGVSARAAGLPDTPGLTAGPYTPGTPTGDPSIAASDQFLVTTNYNQVNVFWKDGSPVAKFANGQPFKSSFATSDLFGPLYDPSNPDNIDAHLNLPGDLKCDPHTYPFGSLTAAQEAATADCVHDIYDARVIYDEYDSRFWIVAQARNNFAGHYQAMSNQADRVGRRTKLLWAVSVDQDPRDGWRIYWEDAVLNDGACNAEGSAPGPTPLCANSQFHPGDAADYPSIGISKDYVTMTTNVGNSSPFITGTSNGKSTYGPTNPSYTMTMVGTASALANGTCNACVWSYGRFNLSSVCAGIINAGSSADCAPFEATHNRTTQPVVEHGTPSGDWTLMTTNYSEADAEVVIGFRKSEGAIAPPLHAAFVPVAPFPGGVADMPQPKTATVTDPYNLTVSNLGTIALRASSQGSNVFTTWQDCVAWTAGKPCTTSVRLTKVNAATALSGGSATPSIDRTFGLRNYHDPPTEVNTYGDPGVEVTPAGDAVVVYQRGGPQLPLESRYSVYMHNESDIRPSAVLHKGDSTIGPNSTPALDMAGSNHLDNFDTAGIARDPSDGGIWMYHVFASAGNPAMAIGEVFGVKKPDLSMTSGIPLVVIENKNASKFADFTVSGAVANVGDGRAGASTGKVILIRGRIHKLVATIKLGPIPPRGERHFSVQILPAVQFPPGPCEVRVQITGLRHESTRADNAITQRVVLKLRRGAT